MKGCLAPSFELQFESIEFGNTNCAPITIAVAGAIWAVTETEEPIDMERNKTMGLV
jgi:hypothetical protein